MALTPWEGTRPYARVQPGRSRTRRVPLGRTACHDHFPKTFALPLVEVTRGKVNNVGLGEPGKDLFDKGNVHRILFDIVLTVFGGGEFKDKGVSDAVLSTMSALHLARPFSQIP